MPNATKDSLLVNDITVQFSGLKALDNLSFEIKSGEILGLIGPNGSGKTTAINAITGQVKIKSGNIKVNDSRIDGLNPRKIAKLGLARSFQIVRLFDNLSTLDNIKCSAIAKGFSKKETASIANEMIENFSLQSFAHLMTSKLSYGDKRRVEIARALASRPQFLFLDEPAAGMNESETNQLVQQLKKIPDDYNLGLLIIDHDMPMISELCNQILVISSGKLITKGSADEVLSHPEVIAAYLGSSHVTS